MRWFLRALKKYADFEGRARRREYWFFSLFSMIGLWLSFLVDLAFGMGYEGTWFGGPTSILYQMALFVPSVAVSIRRLHDTGRNGWWLAVVAVPVVGAVALLVFCASDGRPGANQYGPNPKESVA